MPDPTFEPRIREWVDAFNDCLREVCGKASDDALLDWRHVDRDAKWVVTINGWHPAESHGGEWSTEQTEEAR